MVSSGGRWVMAYNGEIYNHPEVRRRLERAGTRFRGSSDTEVLVAAVERWGVDRALDACEGMFAAALWDRRDRELHLLRDRFGEKPLYYGWVGKVFAFGSELKALCCVAGIRRRARSPGRGALPPPQLRSRAGHHLARCPQTGARSSGDVATSRHRACSRNNAAIGPQPTRWRGHDSDQLTGSDSEMTDQLEDALSDAVAARMVADVPVGAFLSGGIDSSTIVALMQRHASGPVRTFTVGFADRSFDESSEAAAVAAHLGTDHTAVACRRCRGDRGHSPIWRTSGTSLSPTSPRSRPIWSAGWRARTSPCRCRATAATSCSPDTTATPGSTVCGGGLPSCPPGLAGRPAPRWAASRPPWSSGQPERRAFSRSAGRCETHQPRWPSWPGSSPPRTPRTPIGPSPLTGTMRRRWCSGTTTGTRQTITAGRQSPMAGSPSRCSGPTWWATCPTTSWPSSIERPWRCPSRPGSHSSIERILDLAWRLPLDAKLRGGQTKWVLRQVLERHVPAALVERPKMGFGLPIGPWLRGVLAPWAEHLLDERRLRDQGLLDPVPIRRAWDLHRTGRRDLGYELWDVLVLQSWMDRWMPSRPH